MEVRENRLAINKIIDGMGDLVREFKGTVISAEEICNYKQPDANQYWKDW